MKKLFFVLSLFCSLAFCAQEQRTETFEESLYSVVRQETEKHIIFSAQYKNELPPYSRIEAFWDKVTGVIRVREVCSAVCDGEWVSLYDMDFVSNPQETYNELKTIYEKQQEERKQNS